MFEFQIFNAIFRGLTLLQGTFQNYVDYVNQVESLNDWKKKIHSLEASFKFRESLGCDIMDAPAYIMQFK